ncbi:uncharacterized protein VTP21DRAFT_10122 [Calcarisporiella thermophila]|uniref:uncharacterized protein n=1 Tax=Calcarisporiella thermophila TaxID=911321 RepID=UPI003741F542
MASVTDTVHPQTMENDHVHQVYAKIAGHFSQTRYKPWPVVEQFLQSQKAGSIGADVGCGNGKYMEVNKNVYILGSDRCYDLIGIVNSRGLEGLVCDGLSLPYRTDSFDFVISIAVIHHFATPQRRREAVEELLRIVKPGGKILIFVWALEQTKESRRKFEEQDVFVPWVLKEPQPAHKKEKKKGRKRDAKGEHQKEQEKKLENIENKEQNNEVYQRYYHLFKEKELEDLVQSSGAIVEESGYDRDNWFVIAKK